MIHDHQEPSLSTAFTISPCEALSRWAPKETGDWQSLPLMVPPPLVQACILVWNPAQVHPGSLSTIWEQLGHELGQRRFEGEVLPADDRGKQGQSFPSFTFCWVLHLHHYRACKYLPRIQIESWEPENVDCWTLWLWRQKKMAQITSNAYFSIFLKRIERKHRNTIYHHRKMSSFPWRQVPSTQRNLHFDYISLNSNVNKLSYVSEVACISQNHFAIWSRH